MILWQKENHLFFQWSGPGYINRIPEQPNDEEWADQNKSDSMIFSDFLFKRKNIKTGYKVKEEIQQYFVNGKEYGKICSKKSQRTIKGIYQMI